MMIRIYDITPRKLFSTERWYKIFLKKIMRIRFSRRTYFCVVLVLTLFTALYMGVLLAPGGFVRDSVVSVEKGMTLSSVAEALEEAKVVRSPFLFKGAVVLLGGGSKVISGDYFFNSRPTFLEVAWRVSRGLYGFEPIKLTIPEGANIFEIAELAEQKLDQFDSKEFILLAKKDEGYLFPDTYHFLPNDGASVVHATLRKNFNNKIAKFEAAIKKSGRNLHDIITMASLLEEEARDTKTRRMISGILWRRLEISMLLQVDATFSYINGKNTFELTLDDLKDDSPYNTYKYRGLPPGPISNPSLDSIIAAIYPKENPYLFYLADMSGITHYSETFEEHKQKKFRYLP